MPVRVDQIFEKIHPTAHGCKSLLLRGFFKDAPVGARCFRPRLVFAFVRERTLGSLISCKLGCKFWCQLVPKNRAQYEPVAWWFTQRRIGRALRDCYPVSEDLPSLLLTLIGELGGHPALPAGDNSAARSAISEGEGPRSALSA